MPSACSTITRLARPDNGVLWHAIFRRCMVYALRGPESGFVLVVIVALDSRQTVIGNTNYPLKDSENKIANLLLLAGLKRNLT